MQILQMVQMALYMYYAIVTNTYTGAAPSAASLFVFSLTAAFASFSAR